MGLLGRFIKRKTESDSEGDQVCSLDDGMDSGNEFGVG